MSPVFDYRLLRFAIGVIALLFPFIVTIAAGGELISISYSYHTDARDWFVGLLFIVGAFLFAYNGHSKTQSILSKIAGLGAIATALFPTSSVCGTFDLNAIIHNIGSALLFSILTYFCFVIFQVDTKHAKGKAKRRSWIYYACGMVMAVTLISLTVYVKFFRDCEGQVIYYAEMIALLAFGVAWIVSGKTIPFLAEESECYKLFKSK